MAPELTSFGESAGEGQVRDGRYSPSSHGTNQSETSLPSEA